MPPTNEPRNPEYGPWSGGEAGRSPTSHGQGTPAMPGLCRRASSGVARASGEALAHAVPAADSQAAPGTVGRNPSSTRAPEGSHMDPASRAQRGTLPEVTCMSSTKCTSVRSQLCLAEAANQEGQWQQDTTQADGRKASLGRTCAPPTPSRASCSHSRRQRGREQVGSGAGVGLRLGRVTTLWCPRL